MLGLGLSLLTGGSLRPYYAVVAAAFKDRVEADGGTVESMSCLKADLKVLNPIKPPAYTGLLNDYSGAAAAYSLRLLDNTYTGNAIKVRRASDNAEQDIAFSNNELDTATLETFASGTDAFVTTWYDQSGNGVNATQTTASSQPKIVSSGSTILENGKAAVQFDGAQLMEVFSPNVRIGGYLELAVAASNSTPPSTYAALISHASTLTNSVQGYLGVRSSGINWGTFDSASRVFGPTTGSQQIIHRYAGSDNVQYNKVDNVLGNVYNTTNEIRIGIIGNFTSTSGEYIGTAQEILLWGNQDGSLIESGVYNNVSSYY